MNVPVGVVAIALALRFVPESRVRTPVVASISRAPCRSPAASWSSCTHSSTPQTAGWISVETLGLGAIAVALLAGFVILEGRLRHPLIRLGIFRMRSITGANSAMLLIAGGMFAMFFFASIYVQEVLGYSALRAGLAFLPVTLGIIAGAGFRTC